MPACRNSPPPEPSKGAARLLPWWSAPFHLSRQALAITDQSDRRLARLLAEPFPDDTNRVADRFSGSGYRSHGPPGRLAPRTPYRDAPVEICRTAIAVREPTLFSAKILASG